MVNESNAVIATQLNQYITGERANIRQDWSLTMKTGKIGLMRVAYMSKDGLRRMLS